MAKIKLPNVGDTLTARVIKCEVVESVVTGKTVEEVKFSLAEGEIYIARTTADRQLLRCGFGEGEGDEATVFYGDVDGCLLTFYRTANKNPKLKPYWNIKRAEPGEESPVRGKPEAPVHKSAPQPAAPPSDAAHRRDAVELAYKRAWMVAQKVQGKTATAESLQAGAATVFIAYRDNHLLGLFEPKPEAPKAEPPKPPAREEVPPPSDDDEPEYETDDELPFD